MSSLDRADRPRTFESIGDPLTDSGLYELSTDTHIYDLMGSPMADLDQQVSSQHGDALVATAAWSVPPPSRPEAARWLARQAGMPFLTPWRQEEPAIAADLWIDPAEGGTAETCFLVARLDSPYAPGLPLRHSVNAAVNRFEDLRRALEQSLHDALSFTAVRATRTWLDRLYPADEDPLEE